MRPFHPEYIFEVLIQIIPYIWVTLAMVLGTVIFGGIIGIVLAVAKVRRGKVSKVIAEIYIYITRCIPSVVMLFIIYYGLPELLMALGLNINNFSSGFFVIVTFSVLFAAPMAEIFRSSYEAVDKAQKEAALSVGMTNFQTFWHILLPQSVVVALPNFTNALVNITKEGSLAYTVGLVDIMGKGQLIIGLRQGSYTLETYLALTIIYWLLVLIIEKSFRALERRLH